MPGPEELAYGTQALPAQGGTRSIPLAPLVKITLEMRPAQLPPLFGQPLVGVPAVAMQQTLDGAAQQGGQAGHAATAVDQKQGGRLRRRCPQPTQLAGLLPARLVAVLDRRLADGPRRFVIGTLQSGTHLRLQAWDRSQGDGSGKNGVTDFFDGTFTQAVTAREVGQRRRQTRTNTMCTHRCGDDRLGELATVGTGAGMPLMFVNQGRDGGQVDDLETPWRWVGGRGLLGQWHLTVLAVAGQVVADRGDAFGR